MLRIISLSLTLLMAVSTAMLSSPTLAAEMSAEDAWKAMPSYQDGQDMAALLTIDREVIRVMATPADRSACAARLAALLEAAGTTLPAKQYICLQLRQVGTAAEVPTLKGLLAKPETMQMARYALESIPGEESLATLRDALSTLQGEPLTGVINSIAARKDAQAVAKLKELAAGADAKVAAAAFWALGNIATPEAIAAVIDRVTQADKALPPEVAVPVLRCADALLAAGNAEAAKAIFDKLAGTEQATGIRRAALDAILRQQKEEGVKTILAWLASTDGDRRIVAAGHLATLSDAALDALVPKLTELPKECQAGLIEAIVLRKGKDALPLALSSAGSDDLEVKLTGLRMLGELSDDSSIEVLVNALSQEGKVAATAQQALCRLPREAVGKAMLAALAARPEIRGPVLEVLTELKYYEAIDPLLEIAAQQDSSSYKAVLAALRGIADPDDTDISRLVKLLLKVQDKNRDEVERTILVVCEKSPAPMAERAKPVLAALAQVDAAELPKYLPALGRLGGPEVLERINSALDSSDPAIKRAAVRALCNWPTAEMADRLWKIAESDSNAEARQWALRAYVRVVTLKSDRPEAETLAMLQKAMKLASSPEDQRWVLSRASTVRTMDAVAWIAGYLDDPILGQTACQAITELAHHRFLRHPNMDRFGPLLDKVSQISKDPVIVERAKKYRLGL